MTTVTPEIKARVTAKLQEGIAIIKQRYGVTLPYPDVSYDLSGTTAGKAYTQSGRIKYNPVLLMQNIEAFLGRTVPHELAHLAVERIYPEEHRRTWGTKRSPHGYRWQEIMVVLGAPTSRCHSYDVTDVARRKASYTYGCDRCTKTYTLGPKRHANLLRNPRHYWCKCGGNLKLQGSQAASRPAITVPKQVSGRAKRVHPVPTTPVLTFTVNNSHEQGSKFERCYAIYKATKDTNSRKEIIQLFIDMVGMTEKGAATYYQKCKG